MRRLTVLFFFPNKAVPAFKNLVPGFCLALACCSPSTSSSTGEAIIDTPVQEGNQAIAAPQNATPIVSKITRVVDADFADPTIMYDNGTYYAFATNTELNNVRVNVPVRTSKDLITWSAHTEALPELPSWSSGFGNLWAPDMLKVGPNDFRMYFTAIHTSSNVHCVTVGTATRPQGPYKTVGSVPLTCDFQKGTLDASAFKDADGSLYLTYKARGNDTTTDAQIYVRKLSADGLTFAGNEVAALWPSEPWEGNLLEGPNLARIGSKYYLFYSCNGYRSSNYAVGLAVANSPTGPFHKFASPVLSSGLDGLIGPGGQTFFTAENGVPYFILHGWDSMNFNYRGMYLAPISYLAQNANLPL